MNFPQLLVYEDDGRLAGLLRDTARALKWAFREVRRPQECLRLLGRGGPGVLVLRVPAETAPPRTLAETFELLDRVGRRVPDARVVVVGDRVDAALALLAWELGAAFVLFPPLAWDQLPAVVTGLMEAATGKPTEVVAEG